MASWKSKGKRQSERTRPRWENNMKKNILKMCGVKM